MTSGTTTAWKPNRASAPLIMPAGMAVYYTTVRLSRVHCRAFDELTTFALFRASARLSQLEIRCIGLKALSCSTYTPWCRISR